MEIFTKNINILVPWNLLKMKTLTKMHQRMSHVRQNFGFGLLKAFLTFR